LVLGHPARNPGIAGVGSVQVIKKSGSGGAHSQYAIVYETIKLRLI
jgi:hypothetical protein